jgi:hypothetical protein
MGKTKLAQYLEHAWGYQRLSLAGPLKEMLSALFNEMNIPQDLQWEYLYGSGKERVIPEIGVSSRHLMQSLGADWGRRLVSTNIWVDVVVQKISEKPALRFVVDDLRFPNEAAAIRNIDGSQIWRVDRTGVSLNHNHPSDGMLDDIRFDRVISNNGSVQEMFDQANRALAT